MSGDGKQLTYIFERGAKNGMNEKLSFKRSEKTKDVSLVFSFAHLGDGENSCTSQKCHELLPPL